MDSAKILEMNTKLRQPHIDRINMMPFKCCLNLMNPIEVNIQLLRLMVKSWVGKDLSFRVCQRLVPFNPVDVFMATGLDLGGLDVPFDECVVGLLGDMFNPSTTTKEDLIDMFDLIVTDEAIDVDVVCRLYIFICLVTFYFPKKSIHVCNMPCSVLDDLDSLCLYDWGSAVHQNLVQNLHKCKIKIISKKISKSMGLSGNVAVLQVTLVTGQICL